jgi:Flp pilus assembly protein TadG
MIKKTFQRRRSTRSERGQSMVEMALMMVILLTILSGVLDLGRAFFVFIAIQNSAGEGALYAAMNPTCAHRTDAGLNGVSCADPNNVDYRARHESSDGLVDSNQMIISVLYSNGTNTYSAANITEGNPIAVTVSYEFQMLGPYSPIVPGGVLAISATSTQNILDLKKD